MDFDLSKEQLEKKAFFERFAKDEIGPHLDRLEEDIEFRSKVYKKMAKAGLFSLSIPKEFGGNFSDNITYALAMIAISKVDAGLSVAVNVTNMAGEAILKFGNSEQKQFYLPRIGTGDCAPAAFALTERESGSDAKTIRTRAVEENDNYVLSGEKQFISNGDLAEFLIVFAKTQENDDPAHGITAFLLDKRTAGLSVAKKERKLGLLTANLVDLKLDHCKIPKNKMLGKLNEGFKIALTSLDSGRISIAAQSVGIAEAAYEAALNYAQNRKQFDQPLANFEGIAFKLADMRVKLSAAKLLLFKACIYKDQGKPFTLEASEAKLFASESCNEIASEALQIHGGYGYVKDYYPVEKYFRDARVTTIYEGTSEIQRLVIAREILKHQ